MIYSISSAVVEIGDDGSVFMIQRGNERRCAGAHLTGLSEAVASSFSVRLSGGFRMLSVVSCRNIALHASQHQAGRPRVVQTSTGLSGDMFWWGDMRRGYR
jgi:hypothetical protein